MKQLSFIILAFCLMAGCKTPAGSGTPVKDPETAVKKLGLKGITVLKPKAALDMIKHAMDPKLKRDFSAGQLSREELQLIMNIAGFKKIVFVRGNYLTTDPTNPDGPTTIGAIFFSATSPDDTSTTTEDTIVYTEIKVCPPPDASTCFKNLFSSTYP